MAAIVKFDFRTMCEQHKLSMDTNIIIIILVYLTAHQHISGHTAPMDTNRIVCITFQADWTTLNN